MTLIEDLEVAADEANYVANVSPSEVHQRAAYNLARRLRYHAARLREETKRAELLLQDGREAGDNVKAAIYDAAVQILDRINGGPAIPGDTR